MKEILLNVKQWVLEVGKIQLEKFNEDIKYSSKSTKIDMVTEVDILSEKIIIEKIKENYPNHSVISEEKGEMSLESSYTWIIDPLDGTNNYLHKFPIFCISIALKHLEETVLGVVYVPKLNEMFYAIKGKGAFLNENKIEVGNKEELQSCILTTGFPYDKKISTHNNVNLFDNIVKDIQGIRRTGSAAFDLCSVACGRIDGYWELKLGPWDLAAGELIVKEAGGNILTSKIRKENGEEGINVIAGNGEVVKLVYNKINEVYKYF
ncbi:myo-inositol-1(or 4)-monophosphatase [Clostridium tetanomorphum]|uniref:Inositol-1-monophosphatase n=1 Tax=Clostridium tetanomorphum TaxID=1553 RepID=A0A923E4T1_CLOTT|nr:inositol monophosphatase family protein [Clostridium tetanomorphum]MBC2396437.1 inositol monophosphatase [Clostridium tetanomorphum]MBP1863333.1 myo-inositol-1(or 4)-monophosphatase [Clostridium tetanomorphum]NRS83430.1 myo-inositol-1(or 4)-monophosphatase [Clostridium tetanomorphum]NRZ96630.1 myo-inositol-1(or 4)-monophosphatase [Clostridium tetanomorphum]